MVVPSPDLEVLEEAPKPILLRGAHSELFHTYAREILLEGPVGTGKTRTVLEYARWFAETFPGCRILFVRQTRVSITQSVLVTWETQVLGLGHPAIVGTANRANRLGYLFPNGSEVVIGGLDNADRVLSTEYDLVCIFEAAEVAPGALETLGTRLRNWKAPRQQLICDTNPRGALHWLNLRANEGIMTRLLSRHWMNPELYDMVTGEWTPHGAEYLAGIARGLTGARFLQFFLGRWASDAGLIYPMFDASMHIRDFVVEKNKYGQIYLHLKEHGNNGKRVPPKRIWYTVASADWGFTAPATVQIWGIDGDKGAWLMAEVYHTEKTDEWWIDRIVEFSEEFGPLRRIVCDPEDAERIKAINDRLGVRSGRNERRIAIGGNNSVLTGIANVQALMTPGRPKSSTSTEGPKIWYGKNALRYRDDALVAERKPWCLVQEKAQYYWDKNEEGKRIVERPDPSCADHGCDAERYFSMWLWPRTVEKRDPVLEIQPGTFADLLGHKRRLLQQRRIRRS